MGHQLPMAQTGRLLQAIYTTMAGSSAACWRTRLTGSWQHHKCYSSSGRSCFNNSIQLLNFDFCSSEKKVLSTYWKKKCLYYLVLIVCLISKSAATASNWYNWEIITAWRRWHCVSAITIWRRVLWPRLLLIVWRRVKGRNIRLRTMGNVMPCGGKIWEYSYFRKYHR